MNKTAMKIEQRTELQQTIRKEKRNKFPHFIDSEISE